MMFQVGRRKIIRYLFLASIFIFIVSCENTYNRNKVQRAVTVEKSDIVNIAVLWDRTDDDSLLLEGIRLAADEINDADGVFGKRINIKTYYSTSDAHELELAKKIADNPAIAAVIGHRSSANAIPASITYEYSGLLYISPSSSNERLTNHGFGMTFRTVASDKYVSRDIADIIKRQGHEKIAVIDDRGVFGKGLADGVVEALSDLGLETSLRRHYFPGMADFKQLSAELARSDADAIFLSGVLPHAAEFIREARKMGVNLRVYGSEAIASPSLMRIAGDAALGTVVPTSFNPDRNNPLTREFVRRFEERHHKQPDAYAALGYDSMKLIAEAMKRSKSVDPNAVASHFRFIRDWQGVTSTYTFTPNGDVVGKEHFFKYLDSDGFIFFENRSTDRLEDE